MDGLLAGVFVPGTGLGSALLAAGYFGPVPKELKDSPCSMPMSKTTGHPTARPEGFCPRPKGGISRPGVRLLPMRGQKTSNPAQNSTNKWSAGGPLSLQEPRTLCLHEDSMIASSTWPI